MAGPPQEPSWTPAGQEPTQARPGWPQQPSFTPPPPSQQDGYGYQPPAPGGYASPPPPPGYAGQDQTYGSQGQQYQAQAQPDPGPAQWQSVPGVTPGRPGGSRQKALGERGFLGSLFDFSFTSMVTPKIIKVLYVLF